MIYQPRSLTQQSLKGLTVPTTLLQFVHIWSGRCAFNNFDK